MNIEELITKLQSVAARSPLGMKTPVVITTEVDNESVTPYMELIEVGEILVEECQMALLVLSQEDWEAAMDFDG